MKTVVLAEKPSVAKDIARVLCAMEKRDGYLEGSGYAVTWAFGHLVTLADPKEYDEKYAAWHIEDLPVIPKNFVYHAIDDPGARKQLKVIKALFSEADTIVCATDAGREGEAIFRYIYGEVGCTKPFKRLWISSLTDSAIREGFATLKDGSEYDALFLSAKARNEADWLVGLNATRSLTLASRSHHPLSLGRVQTPTLALVAGRFIENRDFKPEPFYCVEVTLEGGGRKFTARYPERFKSRDDAERLLASIGYNVTVKERKTSEKTEKAPLPFDITSLQAEANRRYGFGAQKTLDLVQALYERHKMLTYPRTGSRYLGDDMQSEIESKVSLLNKLNVSPAFREALHSFGTDGINKACFDSSKLTDHHAIIPTFQNIEKIGELKDDEKRIYLLAAVQLVSSLMPVCKKDCLYCSFDFGGDGYLESSGYKVTQIGWRMLQENDADNEEDNDNQLLPELEQGETVSISEKHVKDGMTKKPPLLTEATLLKAMETAGRLVDDEELSKAMKDCGLGTPATRAAVIETLYDRNYMTVEKKHIIPTELGLKVYSLTKDYAIGNPQMTGEWEYKLNQIAEGKADSSDFIREITKFTRKEVDRLIHSGRICENDSLKGLSCPLCGRPLTENSKAFGCTGFKDGCKFVIWKQKGGKTITENHLRMIVESGETDVINGFKSKDGKTFDARLRWNAEKECLDYCFDDLRKEAEVVGKCPLCGREVTKGERSCGCTGYKDGCKFTIWNEVAGKKLTTAVIKRLLTGETVPVKGFKSKSGKTFDAPIRIDKETGKVVFLFNKK